MPCCRTWVQIPDRPSLGVCENGSILKLKFHKTGRTIVYQYGYLFTLN
jgi:hypothetical protein